MRKSSFLPLVFAPSLLTVACGSTSSPSGVPTADASADAGASDGASSGDDGGDAANADASAADAASPRSGFGEGIPPSTTTTYAIKLGASTIVQPGVQAGYGITANAGGTYRLVWARGSTATEFWGSVWTTGHFTVVMPGCAANICPLGAADFVSTAQAVAGGERIDFDAFPTTSLGGFDFVADTEPVYFGLILDGTRQPASIFFPSAATGQISTPGIIPFALTPQ